MTRFTSRVYRGGPFPLATKAECRAIARRLEKAAECVLRDFEWISAEEVPKLRGMPVRWSYIHHALQSLANEAKLKGGSAVNTTDEGRTWKVVPEPKVKA